GGTCDWKGGGSKLSDKGLNLSGSWQQGHSATYNTPSRKTNLSHDGLNPAHVPYWWVNNPTLGEFCFTMIGRADIEGSKSNVAMNAWLPQASYPCGNFSDTSSFKFQRSKGSIGHAFTVRIRTENQNQTSFYPFVPHEISVLVELILGHLRYLLTDVPPQPNSPPDNVLRPDRPAEASLGSKRRGCYPASDTRKSSSTGSSFPADSAKPVPLAVVSLDSRQGHSELAVRRPGKAPERAVHSPSPGRHEAVRSRHVSSSSSPPTVDGFGTGTPEPSPQSQSFSRSYGSILPTSLAYIVPSTRGCSPWRPDAVMSTTGRERHSVLRIFKGRRECTGHHATCGALSAAGPYLRLSRFQGGQARPPRPPTHRGLALARTAGYSPGLGHHLNPRRSTPRIDRRTGLLRSASDQDASPAPIRFPPDNFKHSLTLFSKSFSSLPRGTCSLSVSRPYLALDGIYRPIGAAFPNNPTRRQSLVVRQGPGMTGLSPSLAPLSRELGPGPSLRTLLQTTIRTPKTSNFQAGLFPVRSPLLRESLLVSFPPLIDMLKLSG
ncbi:unnamed protein product, partial [Brassica rapa subsp. trilocularis]